MGRVSQAVAFEGLLMTCPGCGAKLVSSRFADGDTYYCTSCGAELISTGEPRYCINRDMFLKFRRYESVIKYRAKLRAL